MSDKEALIERLRRAYKYPHEVTSWRDLVNEAAKALSALPAEPKQPKPVAWMYEGPSGKHLTHTRWSGGRMTEDGGDWIETPLCAAPPAAEQQPLLKKIWLALDLSQAEAVNEISRLLGPRAPAAELEKKCQHEWVHSLRPDIVQGEWCGKCGKLKHKQENSLPASVGGAAKHHTED